MHYSKCRQYWDDNGLPAVISADLIWQPSLGGFPAPTPRRRTGEPHNLCCTDGAHAKDTKHVYISRSIQLQRSTSRFLHSGAQTNPAKTHYWCSWMFSFMCLLAFWAPILVRTVIFSEWRTSPCKERTMLPQALGIKQVWVGIRSSS